MVVCLALWGLLPAPGLADDEVAASRWFVLVLDGVSFEVAEAAFIAAGETPPELLVSSFPATTHVAMPALLERLPGREEARASSPHESLSPGYESRYFDWQLERARGGGLWSYRRFDFPWRLRFDWLGPGVWGNATGALRPLVDSRRRIDHALEAFLKSPQTVFVAHVGASDRLGHLRGPGAARSLVRYLLEAVERTRRESRAPFRLLAFSDHGMAGGRPLTNVLGSLKKALRDSGLRPTRRLRDARDVALTPFGLVSSFELYAQPQWARHLARTAVALVGVDHCAWRESDDRWRIANADGEAVIERRQESGEEWFRYSPISSDPLGFWAHDPSLWPGSEASVGSVDEADWPQTSIWLASAAWFERTVDAGYPDALFRISRAFSSVVNPATVACSTASGFMFGAKRTERSGRWTVGPLRFTHGALERHSSLGFLWTDCASWSPGDGQRYASAPFRVIDQCHATAAGEGGKSSEPTGMR